MWKCRWNIRWRKMWAFFRLNVCIGFRVFPRLDNPTGACPTHRRQWADFLVSLMAPLHRHRLRAVMFCSEVPIRDTHKSPTNCLPGYGHDPRSAPNLERHGSSKMQTSGWLEMPHFLNRISICISSWNPTVWSFYNITYHSKARYAYCDNPFSVFLLFVSFSYTIEGKASIYEERLLIV